MKRSYDASDVPWLDSDLLVEIEEDGPDSPPRISEIRALRPKIEKAEEETEKVYEPADDLFTVLGGAVDIEDEALAILDKAPPLPVSAKEEEPTGPILSPGRRIPWQGEKLRKAEEALAIEAEAHLSALRAARTTKARVPHEVRVSLTTVAPARPEVAPKAMKAAPRIDLAPAPAEHARPRTFADGVAHLLRVAVFFTIGLALGSTFAMGVAKVFGLERAEAPVMAPAAGEATLEIPDFGNPSDAL